MARDSGLWLARAGRPSAVQSSRSRPRRHSAITMSLRRRRASGAPIRTERASQRGAHRGRRATRSATRTRISGVAVDRLTEPRPLARLVVRASRSAHSCRSLDLSRMRPAERFHSRIAIERGGWMSLRAPLAQSRGGRSREQRPTRAALSSLHTDPSLLSVGLERRTMTSASELIPRAVYTRFYASAVAARRALLSSAISCLPKMCLGGVRRSLTKPTTLSARST